jgi:hypothetical protein
MPGLSKFELAIVEAIAKHHQRACASHAAKLSGSVQRLINAGVLAVRRGSGQKGSQYLMALPKRTMVGRSTSGGSLAGTGAAVLR